MLRTRKAFICGLRNFEHKGLSRVFTTGKHEIRAKDFDEKLKSEIRLVGSILGECIKDHDVKVFEAVEGLRRIGREWRKDHNKTILNQMVDQVKNFDALTLLGVSRSFSLFLALSNSVENSHKIRRLKDDLLSSGTPLGFLPKDDSSAGSIKRLLTKEGVSPAEVINALKSQRVEIVLTAHPTEVNRRTMLQKHHRIAEILEEADRSDITPYDKRRLMTELKAEISSIWESDDLRRSKPSPIEEAKTGLAIVEDVLWYAVPNFLRKLDDVCRVELKQSLPLESAPIKIASWMGGDRDGNPNVTPPITLEVSMLSRWMAATLFRADILKLRSTLSLRSCSYELRSLTKDAREPYRYLLKQIDQRLDATLKWTESYILNPGKPTVATSPIPSEDGKPQPYRYSSELFEPLMVMHRSLVETGFSEIADGALTDTIRRLSTFGLCLLPLDIRQESGRHTEALDAITRYLGIGSYSQWDEQTRRNWLQVELASKRPLLPRNRELSTFGFSETVIDTLETFETAASLDDGCLGAYVISQCQQASDVLAVSLLQQDAGVSPELRVVPLFETLDDLERSPNVIEELFSMTAYRGRIRNKQEIMVGYSDSAKDAGRFAAAWAQHHAQVAMSAIAERYGIEVTFFHGKGGTVGRGGHPAVYEAILAHPPDTVNGRFRVTEQGEMITRNFGEITIAERTLDYYTAGVLYERFENRPVVKREWSEMMETLSNVSCEAYRNIVRGREDFVPYFRLATPEQDLSALNVGSRPAKRNPKGGVESLRAIPWIFAWSQTRLHLPTWLGVGEALAHVLQTNPILIKEMYQEWPWFRTLIDLLEMILVKADKYISENYDKQLVQDPKLLQLGEELRGKLKQTVDMILTVSGHTELQVNNPALLRSLEVRNPYLDPLNIMQAELLKRLRSDDNQYMDEEKKVMRDALLITINGIVNGIRNSG